MLLCSLDCPGVITAKLFCLLCFYTGASQPSLRCRWQGKRGRSFRQSRAFPWTSQVFQGCNGAMDTSFPSLSHCLGRGGPLSSSQLASLAFWVPAIRGWGEPQVVLGSWVGPSIPVLPPSLTILNMRKVLLGMWKA